MEIDTGHIQKDAFLCRPITALYLTLYVSMHQTTEFRQPTVLTTVVESYSYNTTQQTQN